MVKEIQAAVGHTAKVFTTIRMVVTGFVEKCDGHVVKFVKPSVRFTTKDYPKQRRLRESKVPELYVLVDQCTGWIACEEE